MKNRMKLLFSASLALPLIGLSPVLAFAEDAANTSTTTTQTAQDQSSTGSDKMDDIKSRIQARKDKLKIKLAANEKLRLENRCSSAQGKVKSVQGRINGIETSHNKVYDGLVTRLTTLSGKLKTQGVDVAQLNTQITELQAKVATFKTDLATYKQDVSDLAGMDCKADPAGFKASLEATRTEQAALRQDAANIQAYLKDTIRPTLQAIRKQLDPTVKDDTTSSDTTDKTTQTTGGTQ